MKHLYNCILFRIIPVIAAMMAFAGCNSVIYDDEGDCDPIHVIRFNYDWNMKFTNAFPAEVLNVELHVFDSNGTLVRVVSEHVSRENAADYNIELRGLAPGNYSFLAWCGTSSQQRRGNPGYGLQLPALHDYASVYDTHQDRPPAY